jgi:hypothetical protein
MAKFVVNNKIYDMTHRFQCFASYGLHPYPDFEVDKYTDFPIAAHAHVMDVRLFAILDVL